MDVIVFIVCLIALAKATTKTSNPLAYSLCVSSVRCKCSYDMENRLIVDCSGKNLNTIPSLPNNTVFLSLSNNDITVVENGSFANLAQLISLDLSDNSISQIQRDGFQGLDNLQHLNLDSNNVPLTAEGFEPGVFRSLKTLCYLSIQNVNSKRDNSSYLDQIFAELTSLIRLKIDGLPGAIFGPGFLKLHNLRILELSSNKCNMDSISNNTFAYVPFLTYLDVSHCSVHRIEPGAFIPLRHLQYLDISNNAALGLDGLRNASFGLINGSITTLKANKLYPTFHLSVQLNIAHLEFLHQTNIKEVYLDENQIELIESNWGHVCPLALEKLSVVGNKLSFGLYIFEGPQCKSLKSFHGGYQHQTHMPFSSTLEIQYVQNNMRDIQHPAIVETRIYDTNTIHSIDKNEYNIWDILYCNISSEDVRDVSVMSSTKQRNNLSKVKDEDTEDTRILRTRGHEDTEDKNDDTEDTNVVYYRTGPDIASFPIFLPPNLDEIHFQFADLRYELPEIRFIKNSVTFINVSGNSFYKLTGPLVGLEKLKILDISDNFCSFISERFLENVTRLESLFLGNNLLGFVLSKDTAGKILGKLNNLRTLDLSNNQITSLPFQIFSGLESLESLDISHNYLQTFDIRLDPENILHLNLSQNLLTSLPANVQKQLSGNANKANVTVDISNNPLQCDCSTLEFMKWVQYERAKRVTFFGYDSYTCTVNSDEQSFTHLNIIIPGLEKNCANYTIAIWILSICFIVLAVVITTGMMYRYRWKLRYFYYMSKRRYRGYIRQNDSERCIYQFDAFLSYADNNLRFVKFTLLPKVETEGVSLCIHHRDFLPGEEIAANIANAIHSSRKIVVLLDDDFLSSNWCMYELNMARMESIYSRKGENILLLLVKEGLDKSKLPLELLDIIHKETYIEIPEDSVDSDITDICSRIKESILE